MVSITIEAAMSWLVFGVYIAILLWFGFNISAELGRSLYQLNWRNVFRVVPDYVDGKRCLEYYLHNNQNVYTAIDFTLAMEDMLNDRNKSIITEKQYRRWYMDLCNYYVRECNKDSNERKNHLGDRKGDVKFLVILGHSFYTYKKQAVQV